MELERYVRDAKAGWVMGPTNEVLRQFVGKAVLLGFDALDYWNQTYNRRVVENEVKKLDPDGKRELAAKLVEEADGRGEGLDREGLSDGDRAATALLVAGLRPVDRSLESHWVRPGAATAVRLRPDDALTVINRDGGQVAELTRPRRRGRRGRRRDRACAPTPAAACCAACSPSGEARRVPRRRCTPRA